MPNKVPSPVACARIGVLLCSKTAVEDLHRARSDTLLKVVVVRQIVCAVIAMRRLRKSADDRRHQEPELDDGCTNYMSRKDMKTRGFVDPGDGGPVHS